MSQSKLNTRWMAVPMIFGALLASCSDGFFGVKTCTANAVAGINVNVPGGSGLLRLGKTISGTVIEGNFSEDLHLSADPSAQQPDAQLFGAFERVGTYSLIVRVTGYQDFRNDNLKVTRDKSGCHVDPVSVTATLTPLVGVSTQ